MSGKIETELKIIAARLAASKVELPLSLKMATAEKILRIMARRRGFGLFIILGWQRKWRKYLDISDSRQDIFDQDRHDIREDGQNGRRHHDIAETVDFDGAILIDRRGTIIHSGVFIEGLRPRAVAEKLNPGRFRDLSEQFGFASQVHTRHLSAIAASYVFRGTTVFTVSEEDDSFHIFEGGCIVYQRRR